MFEMQDRVTGIGVREFGKLRWKCDTRLTPRSSGTSPAAGSVR